jgi:hypothetical protein
MTQLDPRQARTRYLILLALRWLPSGMLLPVLTLLRPWPGRDAPW